MYKIVKRLGDIFLALVLIIISLPFSIPIMLLLKFTDEGEVWYSQKRIGFKNSKFSILKFATMLKNSPNMGTGSLTLRDDPRVTKIGKYLRKSKINEVPQIYNVLIGDMSFVGPRPQMEVDFLAFTKEVQSRLYDVKPGITGIGSIIFRDEEKFLSKEGIDPRKYYEDVIAPYKGAVEMWYLKEISFLTDLKLLICTAWVILFPNSEIQFKLFSTLPKKSFQ